MQVPCQISHYFINGKKENIPSFKGLTREKSPHVGNFVYEFHVFNSSFLFEFSFLEFCRD